LPASSAVRSISSCRRPKNLVSGIRCQEAIFIVSFCPSLATLILLFGPGGAILPSRPLVPSAGGRRGGQGWPADHREAARSVRDGRGHDGKIHRLGATHFASLVRYTPESARLELQPTKSEASSPLGGGADRASRPCIRSILRGSHHDAVIRIGGELRGGGSTLHSGSTAMVVLLEPEKTSLHSGASRAARVHIRGCR
jgi:hypothetical protein